MLTNCLTHQVKGCINLYMQKVQIWGFRCSRCGHEWVPREPEQQPQTCPKCKSPYWHKPRKADVNLDECVKCKWRAPELDNKTVQFELVRENKPIKGFGVFSAVKATEGYMRLSITIPPDDKEIILSQAEADCIESHISSRRFRFRCVCPP